MLATFYLTCDHFRDMTQPILALMILVEFANDVVTCTTWNNKRVPPYNTTLGSREFWIPEPRSTRSSTLISANSNFLVLIRNC